MGLLAFSARAGMGEHMLLFRAVARATGGSVDQRVDGKGVATTAAIMGDRGSKSRRHVWAYAHDQTSITAGCIVLEVGARPARTNANKRNKQQAWRVRGVESGRADVRGQALCARAHLGLFGQM